MTWKVGPALACGNTVVVKPSEETPLTATLLGEVMNDAGVPRGAYNVDHGFGPNSAGEFLTQHPPVNGITFTGETRTGEAIMRRAALGLRQVSFELGGNNPALIFADFTCGGQATITMVYAVRRATKRVIWGEIVASISSKSAGPGTRANIDEFTETTSNAIVELGGAERGKAIIILNPAEPPLIMRDTVFTLSQGGAQEAIERSVEDMAEAVRKYVPGYRLKQKVQFEHIGDNAPVRIPGVGPCSGLKTTIFLEVEGAAHYLPAYAGSLDIMTSAALTTADRWAARQSRKEAA